MEAHLRKEKTSHSIQDTDGRWCILHHLLGCCLLAQARCASHGMLKEKKVNEAVRFSSGIQYSLNNSGEMKLESDLSRIQKFETSSLFYSFFKIIFQLANKFVS